jgi:Glycosyl hydrolases family 16
MKTILLLIAFFLSLIGQASAQCSSIFTNNINLSTGVPFTFPTGMPINTTSPVILGSPTVGANLVALPGQWTNQDHVTVPIDGTYNLIFDEEFNGSSLDATKWNPNWFGATATSVSTSTGPSPQSASDSAQNTVAGGFFALTTLSNPITIGANSFPYRTGYADSNPVGGNASPGFQFNPTSGNPAYFEARMYVPPAPSGFVANWPSFWATGQNWPVTGEIDVAEGLTPGEMWANYHSSPGAQNSGFLGSNYTGWHVFAALWTTSRVTYYYDGVQVEQYTTGIASAPLFLVMDQMMNPSEGGPNVVPATVLFDYVHVLPQGRDTGRQLWRRGGHFFRRLYLSMEPCRDPHSRGHRTDLCYRLGGCAGAALTVSVTATNVPASPRKARL